MAARDSSPSGIATEEPAEDSYRDLSDTELSQLGELARCPLEDDEADEGTAEDTDGE